MNEIKVYHMALALNKQARNRRKKGIFRSEKKADDQNEEKLKRLRAMRSGNRGVVTKYRK